MGDKYRKRVMFVKKPTIAFIGAGAVGTSLALLLQQQHYTITGIASRSEASAQRAAGLTGASVVTPEQACQIADIIFITTPDREISNVIDSLAGLHSLRPGTILAHTSGAHSSELLSKAHDFGTHILSFHPLQSFPYPDVSVVSVKGSVFTLEGDASALTIAYRLVEDLGGQPVVIQKHQKALYHAGACVASNYFVSNVHFAVALLQAAGFTMETAQSALLPLIRGTLQNLESTPISQALTGPIARGDTNTIIKHMSAMSDLSPELLPFYTQLGLYTVKVAVEKGCLNTEQITKLEQILSGKKA
jgi:predicted short-subunit dehydrogenase-like oxidoreductase (DUF2520 family)